MTDLREKIVDMLDEWRDEIIDDIVAHDWGRVTKTPADTSDIADRILALLPKMPELRWDGDYLRIGKIYVGVVEEEDDCDLCYGRFDDSRIISRVSEPEARAAVEAAARRALGWDDAA